MKKAHTQSDPSALDCGSTVLPCLLLPHLFNGLFSGTTWTSWYQKGKTSLDLNDAKDDGVLGYGGISWTICKQSAPCTRTPV